MASSVKSRPNHYEVLGLSPSASDQDINRAFAKGMGMFGAREIAAAADIGLAFEVLRDPAKRRAYDRAIGVEPEPRSAPVVGKDRSVAELMTWGSTAAAGRVTFAGLAPEVGQREPAPGPHPQPEPEPEPQPLPQPDPQAEVPVEARLASIVASLRELSKQETRQSAPELNVPQAAPPPRMPESPAPPRAEPQLEPPSASETAPEWRLDLEQLLMASRAERRDAVRDDHPSQWKQMALAVGGLVLVAGVTGAVGGMSVKDAEDQLTVPLPPAVRHADQVPQTLAPVVNPAEITVQQAAQPEVRAVTHSRPIEPRPAPSSVQSTNQAQAPTTAAEGGAVAVAANDPLAVETPAAQPVAADLPLPSKVIAHTIDRIGYACGAVASAAAVDGAPGTYKVTCTSGQTYQAAPVRGRYHFRRWSKP